VRQFSSRDVAADSTTLIDLERMLIWPSTWYAWLIGEGRVCQPGDVCYSDIGWIRLLQAGGVVVLVAVVALYAGVIRSAFSGRLWSGAGLMATDENSQRHLTWIFALTFVAATIKGESFGSNEYSRLLMSIGCLAQMVDTRGPAHAQGLACESMEAA
jgi:hypothetical protein